MHVWQHLQPRQQGRDNGQVGQLRTVSSGDTGPQPSSRVAATLQRKPLSSCPCSLPGTRLGFQGIFQGL